LRLEEARRARDRRSRGTIQSRDPDLKHVISRSARDEEVTETTRNGEASSSRSSRSEEESEDDDELRQPRFQSLNDIYNTTGEVHLVCLLADVENITYEEVS
jgi:hypothetical protein